MWMILGDIMLRFEVFLLWKKIFPSARKTVVDRRERHTGNNRFVFDEAPKKLPRTIWIYSDRPINEAPSLVQDAVNSWISKNPLWSVEVLNDQMLPYIVRFSEPYGDGKIQERSNAIRLALLQKYGGVWVDATCFCVRPLDEWLPSLMQSGFFAFPDAHPDRLIQSWFLAAAPENYLVNRWANEALRYYAQEGKVGHRFWAMQLLEYLIRKDRRVAAIWAATPKVSANGDA